MDAAVGTLSAYTYPSDTELRGAAISACSLVGVDYLEAVACTMESTQCDPDRARWIVAASFIKAAATLIETGTVQPRTGVLGSGQPANALGMPDNDNEGD